jgi:streptomycin 6-kinase
VVELLNGIQLPEEFIDTIRRGFQQKGNRWLEDLPALTERCVQQWQLTNVHLSEELSYNLVLFARHPQEGEVVLKIGVPHLDLFSEMRAIRLFEGRGLCRCFALDEALGAMLLERILPGENLWTVKDPEERYRITADLYRQVLVHPPAEHGLPLFGELIATAIERSADVPETPPFLVDWLRQIQSDYAQLEAESGEPVVLHCDLHHGNILRDQHVYEANLGWRVSPGWRVIDPKGFVGVRPVECARFIENELDLFESDDAKWAALERMLAAFAPALGFPERTLVQALAIDNVLNTYWSVESHSSQVWIDSGYRQHALFTKFLKSA